ncbi:amidohydrolase [Frankia sp. AgB1.9]|uniref:amidohydrolase family protein n=1 Tax=unclassified Frankia TaxID=2632575 RepID=UPI0019349199|nr:MULTISPECIES: amidohydrolase family protein [unclassified Frankia]MBL7493527.1 amidohydrolase [Frankia sp. AgW1.1]MBL7551670.1 amidohydrolase [Frankia sp. AgB1.9]MBL7620206.1 amidohydrolase [Frankia sp. AgB1.8]
MSVTTSEQPATQSPTTPLIVVSADTHIGPRLEQELRPYCPAPLLDEFDEFAGALARKREASNNQLGFGGMTRGADWKVSRRNLETEGHFNIEARLRDLDNDGVAGQVIFHDSQNGQPLPFDRSSVFNRDDIDFDRLKVGQHIYNQWLADQVSVQPERHVGLAYVPMWDIDAAVRELRWASSVGLRGVNFPYPRPWMKSYNFPDWEPFFSACEELGMSLCHHGGGAPTATGGPGMMSIVKLEVSNMSRISPLSHLVFGGVFERHPNLRLVLTESVGPWWPAVMKELDSVYIHDVAEYPDMKDRVKRLPSEYAARQVFVGASFLARFEVEDAMANGYLGNIIWGSDYPHFEGTFQHGIVSPEGDTATRSAMRFTFAGLPEHEVAQCLGENAVRAYGLDGAALRKVAARINAPTYAKLSVPLSTLPDEHDRGHHAYRTYGFWA